MSAVWLVISVIPMDVGADFFLLLQQKLLEELAGARLLGIGK